MATNKKENLVPLTTEEVTVEWFESILNIKIDRKSYSALGNVNAGVGFLSNLVRVRFEEIFEDESKKEHCLVVKLLPPEGADRQLVVSERMDKSELHFYQKLIPEMLNEIPTLESYFCPFIYGDVQEDDLENKPYASALVLRDLKRDGFILKPFSTEELSSEEIALTIDFLANFHAAAALLEMRKQLPLSDVYDVFPEWYYPNESEDRQFVYHTWFIEGFKCAKDVLKNYIDKCGDPSVKNSGEEIIANLIEPFVPFAQKIFNEVLRAGQSFPSLIHGDLWQNNLLISTETPRSIKIIDWQMTGYSDSIYDVSIFLISCLSKGLDINVLEKHAKIYFERLEEIYTQKEKEGNDFTGRKRRSWEEFWQTMKTFGATFAFIVYTMSFNLVSAFPENLPKMYEGFRFFYYDVDLAAFLNKLIK